MTVSELLKQGIAACKAGRKAEARALLEQVIELDDHNETAWLWLSGAVETDEDRQICLENVLTINPDNQPARRGLERLLESQAQPTPPPHQPAIAPAPAHVEVPAVAPEPAHGETLPPSPVAVEAAVHKATLPDAQPDPDAVAVPQAQTPKAAKQGIPALWWVGGSIVAVMAILIACAAFGLAMGDQAKIASTPTPVPDHESAIIGVIRENIAAHNAEDAERYMATIHSKAGGRAATLRMLQQSYEMYDLSTRIYNLKILDLSDDEARVSFTLITTKINGPAFRDNQVDGVMILRPDKGQWKLYGQENDNITYLD